MIQATVSTTIPLRTVSGNKIGKLREHMRRKKEQRCVTSMWMKPKVGGVQFPCTVTLTRLSSGRVELDTDNLGTSLKHVRDGVADALGMDDSAKSPITWAYGQETRAKEYGVRIEIVWGDFYTRSKE